MFWFWIIKQQILWFALFSNVFMGPFKRTQTMALLFYLRGAAVEEHQGRRGIWVIYLGTPLLPRRCRSRRTHTHTHTHTSEKGERERAIAIAIWLGSRRDAAVNETTINLVYFGSRRRQDATVDKICSPHVYCGSRSLP